MERTPNTKPHKLISLRITGNNKTPDHSTPGNSTSLHAKQNNSSEDFSPIGSPEYNECLSQDIRITWGRKTPEELSLRRTHSYSKIESTPKFDSSPYVPKPKRRLIRQKYSDRLQHLAEDFKSIHEEVRSAQGKSATSLIEADKNCACEKISEKLSPSLSNKITVISKIEDAEPQNKDNGEDGELCVERVCETVQQDCLVVDLTSDLTSLKSFPSNYEFPVVPKLDLDNDMNKSDYVILMEDHSIEDEMIKCTQQIEEQILGQKPIAFREKENVLIVDSDSCRVKTNNLCKSADQVTAKSFSSSSNNSRNSLLNRNTPLSKNYVPSPAMGSCVNQIKKLDVKVSIDSECEIKIPVKKPDVTEEQETMFMLEDDSFDNIMLELVVEGENQNLTTSRCHSKEKEYGTTFEEKSTKPSFGLIEKSNSSDTFGMLEDDSLIQPDILNYLDSVENQAVAASQPIKCTPEEIQQKMIEAKKKLAVKKRKRKSEMAINAMSAKVTVPTKRQVNA